MDIRNKIGRLFRPGSTQPRPPAPNTVSASDAAYAIVEIETCAAIGASFIAGRDGPLPEPPLNPFSGWSTTPATLKMYRFRNVVLDRTHMVLLQHGRVIAETNYLQPESAIAALRVNQADLIYPKATALATTCFDHWDTNYYHWIAHAIPVLHAIRQRSPGESPTLVLPAPTPRQTETLELMAMADRPVVYTEPGRQYFFPALDYYDIVAGVADFAVSETRRAAYSSICAAVPPARRAKIFIDRANAANRLLTNATALADHLRRRGYNIVRLEECSFAEQVALFQGAAIVVAQHGAGLSNIVFCQAGTIIYELLPSHHRNPCFLAMAMQTGLQYWADMFDSGVPGRNHTASWATDIDIPQIMRRLDQLEALICGGGIQ